jgi:hypothetical protein
MLRVDRRTDAAGAPVLRLSGHLTGPWVNELAALCKELSGCAPAPSLDLAELVFADIDGLQLLSRLRQENFRLVGSSPFIAAQMPETHTISR